MNKTLLKLENKLYKWLTSRQTTRRTHAAMAEKIRAEKASMRAQSKYSQINN